MQTTSAIRCRRRLVSMALAIVAPFLALFLAPFLVTAASAAAMQKVDQATWLAGVKGLPSYVNMYIYVPDTLAAKPPIVVVPHHCQGSASSTNSEIASLYAVADRTGFIVIIPEATGQNCWDAGSARSLMHGGLGDTGAIIQMIRYVVDKYNIDVNRVYAVGGSSGAIMTEALLGVYPDFFMAGVSLMGVPCGCWAQQYHDVVGNPSDGTGQWSSPCAAGSVTDTALGWGNLVRTYYPGYTEHRPRLQHWHGTADTTLNFKVMAEDIKEWTNLLRLNETPTTTDMPKSGTTHQAWKNSCGYTVYETFALSGVGHAVPFDGAAIAAYFGLDKAGGKDPETEACPGAQPGGSAFGAGGAGANGPGGATGAGGGGPGGNATGGASGGKTGGGGSAGGTSGTGGSGGTMTGGSGGVGGSAAGSGGTTGGGAGGVTGTGGTTRVGSGGTMVAGSGGATASSGGTSGSGGARGTGGVMSSGGTGSSASASGDSGAGCGCDASGQGERRGRDAMPLVALFVALALTGRRTRDARRARR